MEAPVAPAALAEQIQRFGDLVYAVTSNAQAKSHVVSVTAGWRGDEIVFTAGTRTSGNIEATGSITLLWPAPADQPYSLIVDGDAYIGGDEPMVAVRPTRAVLHRVARADPSLPSCVTLLGP